MERQQLRQQGKEAAQLSLGFFRRAFDVRPSDKMLGRLKRSEKAMKELYVSDEEEEFVNVRNSGLMIYKGLYDQLYEHQKDGVAFLYSLHRDGHVGGILADNMGLGKTVQVLSFLSALYHAKQINHTLLVMPTSLIKKWLNEFKHWTPGFQVIELHGKNKLEHSRNLERIGWSGHYHISNAN
ncbi:DNA excision repair protein ERCC-6-like isoform X2 [Silurus meridionalis]|nr:DNA excision repair protein ERCC-6-like isoform X2 [Silurus meridionalis]